MVYKLFVDNKHMDFSKYANEVFKYLLVSRFNGILMQKMIKFYLMIYIYFSCVLNNFRMTKQGILQAYQTYDSRTLEIALQFFFHVYCCAFLPCLYLQFSVSQHITYHQQNIPEYKGLYLQICSTSYSNLEHIATLQNFQ